MGTILAVEAEHSGFRVAVYWIQRHSEAVEKCLSISVAMPKHFLVGSIRLILIWVRKVGRSRGSLGNRSITWMIWKIEELDIFMDLAEGKNMIWN
jgi:hypothetical protein